MTYSGAHAARTARENLGRALAALQEDTNIPPDVMAVAQNIAQAVGALFDAERSKSEQDGKASVKAALGMVGQTLALLQDVRGQHRGIQLASEGIAQSMSILYPLTTAPSMRPPPPSAPMMGAPSPVADQTVRDQPPMMGVPAPVVVNAPPAQAFGQATAAMGSPVAAAFAPTGVAPAAMPAAMPAPAPMAPSAARPAPAVYRDANKPRENVEVNIGANTESNFYVGFSGEIAEGGVFSATYSILARGTPVRALVTLPGGFETHVNGYVRFVRDPMDMATESEPGMGIQFEGLDSEQRELILRFVRKRRPIFYDD